MEQKVICIDNTLTDNFADAYLLEVGKTYTIEEELNVEESDEINIE